MPFGIASLYLPGWLCLALMVANGLFELAGFRLLARLDPRRTPGRYLYAIAAYTGSQISYMMIPALVWQVDDPYAKALAVGFFLVNVIHLSTIRTVHFPLAAITLVPATIISLAADIWFWLGAGHMIGLGISIGCVVATVYFVAIMMTTVHELHQQMFRDQQAAEAANEAKSRFLAQMSHELRTPLNAILGMGHAELSLSTTAQSRERLATLVQSAGNLSVLLDDILDLSAVEAGQLPIRPAVVDLRAETSATLALFRQQISDAGLHLTLSVAEGVPAFARIDGQRFRQCLSNVLNNAVKYTRDGTISVALTMPETTLLAIEVADTGPGVSDAMARQIFEPFQRGDSQLPGTGLGLSISRTLARRMGGDLVLVPDEAGARFRLSFGLEVARPQELATPEPAALADLAGKRVLVVDDIGTNRLVAMTYLHLMGASGLEAASGQAALDLLAHGGVDLVLLDMLMPDMDGLATFAGIRALAGVAGRVPVIAMTADATDAHRRKCLTAGLNGYVAKPLSPEALGREIQTALQPPAG